MILKGQIKTLALALFSLQLSAATINVKQQTAVATLAKAIDLAASGDTIYVHAGHYNEGNLLITKELIIIGLNRPVMDGNLEFEIFIVAAQNVTIQGFKIINSGRSSLEDKAGIKCLDAHYVKIQDNLFENTFFGIHLSNTNYATIESNQLKANAEHEYQLGNGIHLWKCTHADISNNTVTGHRDGIYFEFVTHSSTRKNLCNNNMRYGLHFMFSHDDQYEDNVFRNNGAGVSVMYTRNVTMLRNTFEDNWGTSSYGMLLKDISNSKVYRNRFIGNTSGIYMEGTSRTVFEENTFDGNGWAIKLQASCDDNVLKHNNFTANTFDISTNGSLVLNNINNNYWDKYEGYDLDRNGVGDIPYRPVNLFSMITERVPAAILLWRSFLVFLLDRAEKIIPAVTPENLKDNQPSMQPYDFS
jgi:nitrous oxidase accessory protein